MKFKLKTKKPYEVVQEKTEQYLKPSFTASTVTGFGSDVIVQHMLAELILNMNDMMQPDVKMNLGEERDNNWKSPYPKNNVDLSGKMMDKLEKICNKHGVKRSHKDHLKREVELMIEKYLEKWIDQYFESTYKKIT